MRDNSVVKTVEIILGTLALFLFAAHPSWLLGLLGIALIIAGIFFFRGWVIIFGIVSAIAWLLYRHEIMGWLHGIH